MVEISNEEKLLSQIRSYKESQKEIKNYIRNNIQKPIDLYLINKIWFDQWKKYSCYDYVKFNLTISNDKYKEIRKKNNADNLKIEKFNNKNLIIYDNSSENTCITINPKEEFYLVTKKCFNNFFSENSQECIKYQFLTNNNKIYKHLNEKIFVLFLYKKRIHFFIFYLDKSNNFQEYVDDIINSNIVEYLQKNGNNAFLVENKIQIISNNLKYNLNYLNKSFISNKNKDTKFKQLISSLINFENNILFQYQSKILFLINENWIQSFMMKLNYINLKNRNNEKQNNQKIIEEMFNEYINNNIDDEDEDIINPNNLIYTYLQDNNSGDIIKYYSKYSLVSEEIWEILIKFFNWNNNICVNAYFIQNNNIIAQYDETNFEIIEAFTIIKLNINYYFLLRTKIRQKKL